jgi:DNA helicase-2/ATP-dependent DNA helicase PcrA
VERVQAFDDVAGAAREGCRVLFDIVTQARRELTAAQRPPSAVARSMCDRIELKKYLDTSGPSGDAAAKRWANVEGVLATLEKREERGGEGASGLQGLAAFLHLLTLDTAEENEAASDVVTLSTLHGSKGLEFEVVFLIGCEEGYLPHARTLDPRATDDVAQSGSADIEEERRLFYVGVTRAKERLTLSRARSRVLRGKAVPRTPSRFLLDVPPELLEEVGVKDEMPTTTEEASTNVAAILALLGK